MRRMVMAVIVLVMATLSCRTGNPERKLVLYPSPTSEATQTPFLVEITTTPVPTTYIVITATAKPTEPTVSIQLTELCVSAEKAVNLRPSANDDGYPILQLSKGDKVTDMGGRSELDGTTWMYVQIGKYQGWINSRYLGKCK